MANTTALDGLAPRDIADENVPSSTALRPATAPAYNGADGSAATSGPSDDAPTGSASGWAWLHRQQNQSHPAIPGSSSGVNAAVDVDLKSSTLDRGVPIGGSADATGANDFPTLTDQMTLAATDAPLGISAATSDSEPKQSVSSGFSSSSSALRTSVYPTTVYPYDDVCYITTKIAGTLWQGSGVIIGPHTVLTASHMLWDQDAGQSATIYRSIRVILAVRAPRLPANGLTIST